MSQFKKFIVKFYEVDEQMQSYGYPVARMIIEADDYYTVSRIVDDMNSSFRTDIEEM